MKILLLGNVQDMMNGVYIIDAFEQIGHFVGYVDIRDIVNKEGITNGQSSILSKIDELDFKPDMVMVFKGLELTPDTFKKIKDKFSDAVFVNWFFDVYLGDKKIWENEKFFDILENYDYFMCSLKGVADKLNEIGFHNAVYVPDGCHPDLNGEQYMNNFQKNKYGEDISFIGNIGYSAHRNRIKILFKIIKEGFNIKIWGELVSKPKSIPLEIREHMTGELAINEKQSLICQSSLITLGIDQDPSIDEGWANRLYRSLCAGALYLSTPTKGLENKFNINKKGEDISEDQDLVVFYDNDDLIRKIDILLEDEDLRKKISENGKNKVLKEHTFKNRAREIINLVEVKRK